MVSEGDAVYVYVLPHRKICEFHCDRRYLLRRGRFQVRPFCDAVTMWVVTVPLGLLTAFYFKIPILAVYFIINLDEIIKLPAVYIHYKKYNWVRDITRSGQ